MSINTSIFDPSIPISLKEAGTIMLPIAGTLLGLVYAANIYWLQEGISRLESTRSLLENLIISNAKIILDLLIISAAVSIFAIIETNYLITIAFWIFAVIFFADLLRATAEQGYINILFSSSKNKIILRDSYSKNKNFILKLVASGMHGLSRFLLFSTMILFYPLLVSANSSPFGILSDKGTIIFIFTCSFIALLQIKPLLTQAFDSRKEIERTLETENEERAQSMQDKQNKWSFEKRNIEEKIISERLGSIGIVPYYEIEELNEKIRWTSRDLIDLDAPVLMYNVNVKEYGSVFLIIIIPYLESDQLTRKFIFKWTKDILRVLAESNTDVKRYDISIFRKDGGPTDNHFGIVGASRDEVIKNLSKNLDDECFVKALSRRYLSDAVAEF